MIDDLVQKICQEIRALNFSAVSDDEKKECKKRNLIKEEWVFWRHDFQYKALLWFSCLFSSDVTSTKTLKYKYEYKYPSLKYKYKYQDSQVQVRVQVPKSQVQVQVQVPGFLQLHINY